MDSLQYTQLAFQESQPQLYEVVVELEWVQSTLAPDLVQLHIVVGGEFASTVGDEGCDDVADTSIQLMRAIGTEEVRALGETSSHGDLLPSTGSESISFHTASSIG